MRKQKGQVEIGTRHHDWSPGWRLFSHQQPSAEADLLLSSPLWDSSSTLVDSCCVLMIQVLFLAALRLKMQVEPVRDAGASASDIHQADCEELALFASFLPLKLWR